MICLLWDHILKHNLQSVVLLHGIVPIREVLQQHIVMNTWYFCVSTEFHFPMLRTLIVAPDRFSCRTGAYHSMCKDPTKAKEHSICCYMKVALVSYHGALSSGVTAEYLAGYSACILVV